MTDLDEHLLLTDPNYPHELPYEAADFGFIRYINDQAEWARETFGPGQRVVGVVEHIRKELDEVLKDPSDLSEWADIIILALDGASRQGYTGGDVCDALYRKFAKNRARKWPDWRGFSEDQPIEHDRGEDG